MKLSQTIPLHLLAGFCVFMFFGCGGDSASGGEGISKLESHEQNLEEGSVLLKTEIPPEQIEGTPMPIKVPDFTGPPTSAPTIPVPPGTVNLALGKNVTGSDNYPIIGDLSYVTDGDKQAGEGYYVELMNGLQWVQIDLGVPAEIYAIWIWHYHSQKRVYHDVIVQVSNDPLFKDNVITVYNNDYDESSGIGNGDDRPYVESRFGKLIDVESVEGRYVRAYSQGNTSNDMNHYIEVEVYGISLE